MRIIKAQDYNSPVFNLAGAGALYVKMTDLFGEVAMVALSCDDNTAVYAFAPGKGDAHAKQTIAEYLANHGASHADLRRAGLAQRDYTADEALDMFGRIVEAWADNNAGRSVTGKRDGDVFGMFDELMALDLRPVFDVDTQTFDVGYIVSDGDEHVWSYAPDGAKLMLLGIDDGDGLDAAADTDDTAYNSLIQIENNFHGCEQALIRGWKSYFEDVTVDAAMAEMGWTPCAG